MKVRKFSGIWFSENQEPTAVLETDQGQQLFDVNGLGYLVEQQLKKGGSVDPLLNTAWQTVRQYQLATERQ